jgi:hypothetical protein
VKRGALRFGRLALGLLTFVVALVVARTARAQRADITTNVDSALVEVGDTITYSQQVMAHGGLTPSDPKPGALPGFSLRGVSSAPMHMRMSVNGSVDDVNGLMTSWTLRAEKVGTFTLGPSHITLGGGRRSGAAVTVRVIEAGKGAPRMRGGGRPSGVDPFGANPLDPFKGLFDFGDDDRAPEPAAPSGDPKLAMDAPRAPIAFLHATVDKTRAVVGEQVTLNVYLYEDPYARQGRPGDVHEATANDFVKRSLLEDETRAVGVGTALVGGKLWTVKLVRRNALFPLKTGHLAIEPMSLTLPQARVGLRASETLGVDVSEPPIAGRPAGYAVGDVGDMSLQATVAPRATTSGGAIGVTVELRGTGNLPGALTLPTVPGVEWLEPQLRDKLGPLQNDRFGGTRTLSYVVRLHREGAVDLGEIRLPYFDPDKRAYAVTRATLGIVNVAAGPARDAGAEQPEVILAGMPKERHSLEGPHVQAYLSERPVYWIALFGSPLACVLALSAQGLLARYRERRAAASPSPDRIAKERRAEADAACKGTDAAAAMGAVARAVEAEVLLRTGVNLRGAASDTVKAELEDAGIEGETAASILGVLRACEDARFSPDGVGVEAAREAWARARDVLDTLARRRSKPA